MVRWLTAKRLTGIKARRRPVESRESADPLLLARAVHRRKKSLAVDHVRHCSAVRLTVSVSSSAHEGCRRAERTVARSLRRTNLELKRRARRLADGRGSRRSNVVLVSTRGNCPEGSLIMGRGYSAPGDPAADPPSEQPSAHSGSPLQTACVRDETTRAPNKHAPRRCLSGHGPDAIERLRASANDAPPLMMSAGAQPKRR